MPEEVTEQVAEAPQAVVHTVESVPETTVHVAQQAPELPHAAIHTTLQGLQSATEALTSAANRLADLAEKSVSTAQGVVETPLEESAATAEEIAPDIVEPPTPRYVRRNGRRVKR